MKPLRSGYRLLFAAGVALSLAVLAGCPSTEPPPAVPTAPAPEPTEPEEGPEVVLPEPDPFELPDEPPIGPFDPPPDDDPFELPMDDPAPPVEEPMDEFPADPADEPMDPEPDPMPEPDDPDDTALSFPKPPEIDDTWEPPKPEPWDLGPPLVDNADQLKALDPEKPVWLDVENKSVVLVGKICQREVPLELFACIRYTKEHEAIVVADVKALTVHAGLLAVGAEPGGPVQFHPEYRPARGTEIEVTVRWKDAGGKVQTARAQDWIQNTETDKAMTEPWVFAGSGFWVDESTGEKTYQAEAGDFICVANFATAMLDVPVESSQANQMLMYRAFAERIPPLETPVTLILRPVPAAKEDAAPPAEETPAEADEPAEAAEPAEAEQPAEAAEPAEAEQPAEAAEPAEAAAETAEGEQGP